MCEFCEKIKKSKEKNINVGEFQENGMILSTINNITSISGNGWYCDYINIFYCPKCGKKISEIFKNY